VHELQTIEACAVVDVISSRMASLPKTVDCSNAPTERMPEQNGALSNVGYMLLGLIALALVLSLRLKRTRAVAVAGEARAPAG
jgi:hypothetical protein